MNKIFRPGDTIVVPDGTGLQEILGPRTLSQIGIPVLEEVSTALGTLPPGVSSDIHVHPVIVHLSWVVSGQLTVRMKDLSDDKDMYSIDLLPGETVLTRPSTLFQLVNKTLAPCQVLYICAPAFVFETDKDGKILYNDQIVMEGKSWDDMRKQNWKVPELADMEAIKKARAESIKRLNEATGKA